MADQSLSEHYVSDGVKALPRRTAHATHALLEASREAGMPVTGAEVCIYDGEAISPHATGRALSHAARCNLAAYTGRYWVPTNLAYDLRPDLENRYLADTARDEDCCS